MDNTGRIFPASMRSRDVLDALLGEAASNLWQLETDCKVSGLRKEGELWEITLHNGYELRSGRVVIAAGGITYPETGSDGSMFGILEDLGMDIDEPRPALAPVYVENYPYAELSGVSIPDVTVIAFSSDAARTCKGKAAKMKGDLLFTHEGLSGPVILNISKYVEPGELLRLCYNKELYELPKRMQRILRERARGLLGDVRTNVLAGFLNQDDFIVSGVDERGMVTAGGVSLDEIDMQTMKAKRFEGLYVIGEALNADGITGGYNLQLCWSTACTAADDLKKDI
jgi:predicted flavoprotein YhiN